MSYWNVQVVKEHMLCPPILQGCIQAMFCPVFQDIAMQVIVDHCFIMFYLVVSMLEFAGLDRTSNQVSQAVNTKTL